MDNGWGCLCSNTCSKLIKTLLKIMDVNKSFLLLIKNLIGINDVKVWLLGQLCFIRLDLLLKLANLMDLLGHLDFISYLLWTFSVVTYCGCSVAIT